MPNIKSAKKRVKQTKKKSMRNVARKSAIKTASKKVISAIELKDIPLATEMLKDVTAKLMRAKNKKLMHRNAVARKISRLAKKLAKAARTTDSSTTTS